MKTNSTTSINGFLIGASVAFVTAVALILLTPRVVGAIMGTSGDGVGQFCVALALGTSGLIVVVLSMAMLLMLSLLTWLN